MFLLRTVILNRSDYLPDHLPSSLLTRRRFNQLFAFGLGLGLGSCAPHASRSFPTKNANDLVSQEKADLVIWWEQGYLPEENAGITQLVRHWEEVSGLKATLKLMEVSILQQELLTAIAEPATHQIPDVVFVIAADANLAPKLAWGNHLTHVSDILKQNRDRYTPDALSQVVYRNNILNERHAYAIPIGNAGEYIHCWSNLLGKIGLTIQDIPQEWNSFWKFWQQSQTLLRNQGYPNLFGIGLCMSAIGVDTFTSLRWFLDAYNTTVVTQDGQLALPEPENRQKLIEVLKEYTGFYQQGFVPPDATDWTASGNNARFLDSGILMTHNPTLSIPLTQKLDPNPYNQDALERYQQIVTLNWPQKLDGTAMRPRQSIKQVFLPRQGKHPEPAKDFILHLIQPDHLNQLLKKGFKGRFLPVMPQLLSDPYWHNAHDPHLSAALQMQQQPSPLPYEILNPAYSQILGQQIWGKTILKILQDKASPEETADWAIAQIRNIWMEWEKKV